MDLIGLIIKALWIVGLPAAIIKLALDMVPENPKSRVIVRNPRFRRGFLLRYEKCLFCSHLSFSSSARLLDNKKVIPADEVSAGITSDSMMRCTSRHAKLRIFPAEYRQWP
ncbi:MAG: hypothetical protein ACOX5Z_00055 [Desulfobulbus sp.]|jgi:hypothetical protein